VSGVHVRKDVRFQRRPGHVPFVGVAANAIAIVPVALSGVESATGERGEGEQQSGAGRMESRA